MILSLHIIDRIKLLTNLYSKKIEYIIENKKWLTPTFYLKMASNLDYKWKEDLRRLAKQSDVTVKNTKTKAFE